MNYLPVFIDLKMKSVLVVGGGDIADRKIRLLLKAKAIITVISIDLSPNLILLHQQKKIIWVKDIFRKIYLKKIYLVISTISNNEVNLNIVQYSNEKYLLVNIVDDLDKCSFIFPSIINRSPIVVAVSSSGQAPVLSRLIKEQIERILPFKIGLVANLAGKLRNKVKNYFHKLSDRRYFWEKIFNGVFVNHILNNNLKLAIETFYLELKSFSKKLGELIIVGAGPGDIGLLTLRGLQVLQQADVVLYDYLVQKDMLNLVRFDAQCIFVGKCVNDKKLSWKQKDINNLIIKLVQEGKKVVRLKGGDSFIFGRGMEELEVVRKLGANFQIVPGITAAIGTAAYAGIPLTHRKYAQNILFLNAYSSDFIHSVNWLNLSKKSFTIVIYMARKKIKLIFLTLINYGFSKNTPIALISQGTTLQQKIYIDCLKNLESISKKLISPTLLIIGEVVHFHEKFKWFNY
ncbi:Siroheme synthase [Buchnera aphidicola (Eriosoma grossulariae)]|uniref:siroheme synthase CysG n=1 Tax=Buchnera aphidicola TaxID=9 RepID=UPI003463C653